MEGVAPRGGIFAQLVGEDDEFHVRPPREPLADAQPRRSGRAVDKNFLHLFNPRIA